MDKDAIFVLTWEQVQEIYRQGAMTGHHKDSSSELTVKFWLAADMQGTLKHILSSPSLPEPAPTPDSTYSPFWAVRDKANHERYMTAFFHAGLGDTFGAGSHRQNLVFLSEKEALDALNKTLPSWTTVWEIVKVYFPS